MSIDEYWSWWQASRGDVAAAMDANATDAPVLAEMMERIHVLGLGCETGPGRSARYAICVTAEGDPETRKLAYRWRDAAPPADEVFEFHPARIAAPADRDFTLSVGQERFAVADLRFVLEFDEDGHELTVEVQHPGFAQLDENERMQIGYLALDSLLGEEEVERWIGEIEWSAAPPTASAGPNDLRAIVMRLRETAPRSARWAQFRGVRPDGVPVAGMAVRPLRPVDHPYLDAVCELTASLADQDLSALKANEKELRARFDGRAFHAVSLTEDDLRTAFVYVDRDTTTSVELQAWAAERGYGFDSKIDPGWEAVARFR